MSNIEQEIRLEVNKNQIEKVRINTDLVSERKRMIDITCGKYGFDSLSKVGYICRVRAKNGKYKLEIKNYLESEKAMEKSIEIKSVKEGVDFLSLLGMDPYLVLDRYRETRKHNDLLICIDEFQDDIGDYIEIEYQEADRNQAIQFMKDMGLDLDLKEKYGDLIKMRLENDKEFEKKFTESLDSYKKNL